MKLKLYDCFEHLLKYNNIWLYSDPHFGDEQLQARRKISDEEQIKRINSKVGKKDVIIILGDIGNTDYIKQIKGYKILVMGNHDAGSSNYQKKVITVSDKDHKQCANIIKLWKAWCHNSKTTLETHNDNKLFDEVYTGVVTLNEKIILSHERIDIPFMLNIHGHNHHSKFKEDDKHLNVCAETINYTPVNLAEIVKDGYLSNIKSIHKITIDSAVEKARKK